jgi:hypothetical protein
MAIFHSYVSLPEGKPLSPFPRMDLPQPRPPSPLAMSWTRWLERGRLGDGTVAPFGAIDFLGSSGKTLVSYGIR